MVWIIDRRYEHIEYSVLVPISHHSLLPISERNIFDKFYLLDGIFFNVFFNIQKVSFFMSERVRLWRCRTLISKSPRIVIKYPWQSLPSAVPRIHICSSQTEAGPPPEMRSARRRWRLFSWKTFSARKRILFKNTITKFSPEIPVTFLRILFKC